jgi:hypothetical protein
VVDFGKLTVFLQIYLPSRHGVNCDVENPKCIF